MTCQANGLTSMRRRSKSGGRGVMVAATDLKSVFRKEVRVRVPPPAPILLEV
jgi:hypothetical protein